MRDEQVGIGLAGGVEVAAEGFLVDVRPFAGRPVGDDAAAGVDDLAAPRVVEGDVEAQAPAVLRGLDGGLELAHHRRVQLLPAAEDVEADVVLSQRLPLPAHVLLEQVHQRPDLEPRALPVLHREGVEGEHLEAEAGRRLDRLAHRGDARPVPFDAGQVARLRPAAVAVHDDGDVARQTAEIEPANQQLFRGTRGRKFGQVCHG